MKVLRDAQISLRNSDFEILTGTSRSQIALMVLQPGETSGEYGNEHAGSDQVMIIIEGKATALIEGEEVELGEDDVILIEAGEQHQVRCAGDSAVRTLNIYSPPGY
jgi:mannose-6-phosphate isomerase-like protein (cupin superfamily)